MFKPKSLETRTGRTGLAPRGGCYFAPAGRPGVRIGYRRLADEGGARVPGTWTLAQSNGAGVRLPQQRLGLADDRDDANGVDILTFEQARAKALDLAGKPAAGPARQMTVGEAIEAYRLDLVARGRCPTNATAVKAILGPLAQRPVPELKPAELKTFRDGLGKNAANLNRLMVGLKAALELAAGLHEYKNGNAWKVGLKAIKNANKARDVDPLGDDQVLAVIEAAYAKGPAIGLFIEVGAETAARPSQIARLQVRDLDGEFLLMPCSFKGTEDKEMRRNAVPVSPILAARLREAALDRPGDEPLLRRCNGTAWNPEDTDIDRVFPEMTLASGKTVTFTWLRTSGMIRMILADVPVTLVAIRTDTSIGKIEKNYARYIERAEKAAARKGLLGRPLRVVA